MKKLLFSYDNQLNGECWTFYKLAILNTSQIAKSWLATHIEFYINENMCGGYSNADGDYYRMRYFADILAMRRLPVSVIIPRELIDIIMKEIDISHYIVVYVNSKRLNNIKGLSLHELLIYGYDENKRVCFCPVLCHGRFIEKEIPFDIIVEAYNDARNHFLSNGWNLLVKRSFFFGITALFLREDFQNDNWMADYIDKIDHEIHGKRIVQTDINDETKRERVIYTGQACLVGLCSYFNDVITEKKEISEEMLQRLCRTLKMMYDYRCLFLSSMMWFINMASLCNNSKIMRLYNDYRLCAQRIQNCYLLLCKYHHTRCIEILEDIKYSLKCISNEETNILSDYRQELWPYYYSMNGVPMLSE